MGKILTALLANQLFNDSEMERRSPKHQELCDKNYELQGRLAKILNDEQKVIFDELMETNFKECCCVEQLKLERGFVLGVLLTVEIFLEQDTFL